MFSKLFKNIGPGTLVAAAFIGPGTVTICTLAGVQFSFTLIWAVVLSILATIVLQEMTARLGLATGQGLAEAVRSEIKNPIFKWLSLIIIMSAIIIGNAAYEAGNISGGVLGLSELTGSRVLQIGSFSLNGLSLLIGIIAFSLLIISKYKLIEKILVTLVIIMSLAFIITAILTAPSIAAVLEGVFIPRMPEKSLFMVIGLVGTTVVPYNLFLHASLVNEKWLGIELLSSARKDLYLSLGLGGLVSIAIIICGAAIEQQEVKNAADLARGLEPLFGSFAKYFLALGLFAAGISSAITAPLAASYAAKGCFAWKGGMKSWNFRLVWMTILILGIIFSSMSYSPITIIRFAQVSNGILLPFIAGFLLWIMNREQLLGVYKNRLAGNIVGIIILLCTILLGIRGIDKVFHFWG